MFLYGLNECIFANLFMRDQMTEYMAVKDKLLVDDKIMASMVICYCFNYNTFLSSTLIMPPMFALSYYFQLTKQVELWWHPYLHRPFESDEEAQGYIVSRMILLFTWLILLHFHFYLT